MPYVGKKPADIIATAVDTTTGTFSGVVDADAGITVDNITIDGTEIDLSSGDLTVDVAGDITLDAGGGNIILQEDGVSFGELTDNSGGDFDIKCPTNNADIRFKGVDGGSTETALRLDMSEDGHAIFKNGVTLTDGNLVVASGHGIDFSATGDATGMTSELLDNYEEGTFSVTIRDASSGGNTGSVSQNNKYTKVGDTVWMHFNLVNITTTGMTGGNTLFITGLPFTPASGSNGCGSIFLDRFDIDNNRYQVNLFQNASQSYATVLQNADFGASSATGSTAPVSLFDNGTADLFGTYMIKV